MAHNNKNGTAVVRTVCTILFLLFTAVYLYCYQADILAVTQHVLSKGATHYNAVVGTVIITGVLWLLQLGVATLAKVKRDAYALTFFPSLLLLAILTDAEDIIGIHSGVSFWVWLFPLLIVLCVYLLWMARQWESLDQKGVPTGIFSRLAWRNVLEMVVMMLIVCAIGCNDQRLHYRAHIESCLLRGDYAGAAEVGESSARADSSLTMLRCYALSEEKQLGERLFTYPLVGRSDAMLPNGRSVRLLMVPDSRLYHLLGARPKQPMRPRRFLELLHKQGLAKPAAHDWLLCAYLLDCDLDAFVRTLPRYYKINASLPKHYREALTLYVHSRQNPSISYQDAVMEADFADYQSLIMSTPNKTMRQSLLRDSFGKTYWYYYACNKE